MRRRWSVARLGREAICSSERNREYEILAHCVRWIIVRTGNLGHCGRDEVDCNPEIIGSRINNLEKAVPLNIQQEVTL